MLHTLGEQHILETLPLNFGLYVSECEQAIKHTSIRDVMSCSQLNISTKLAWLTKKWSSTVENGLYGPSCSQNNGPLTKVSSSPQINEYGLQQ